MPDESFSPATLHRLTPAPGGGTVDPAAAYAFPAGDRPWLRANFVSSLDGSATVAGRSGGLGNRTDQRIFALLRALADVIVVGAGTARAEGYGPAEDDPAFRKLRAGRPATAPIAVVTRRADLDPDGPLLADAPADARTIVIAPAAAGPERLDALRERAEVIVAGADAVDLPAAIDALAARGHRRISCEGGPSLFADLIAAGLVDELCLTISPLLAIGTGPRIARGPRIEVPQRMRLTGLLTDDDFLFARYTRV